MLKMSITLVRALAGTLVFLAFSMPAWAHPHVWVKVESVLLSKDGAFTGLQHKWTFDEFYSAMAVEGLDTNKDGKYDRQELAELAKVNVTSLKDFEYFTYAKLGDQALKVADPSDYWLEHKNGVLSLHFTVPFAAPVRPEAKVFTFAVYDPSFFIAFELAKTEQPVRLGEGAPKGCALRIGTPERDPGDVSALGESISALTGFGVSVAKTVFVECSRPR